MAKRPVRPPYRLFLSHSHKDRWIAHQVVRVIEEGGAGLAKVFVDERDIEFGQSIPDSIRENIRLCDQLIVLLSSASRDRPWVIAEIAAAWQLEKEIIVVLDKLGADQIPEFVRSYRAVDLNDFDTYLEQLMKRIGPHK